MFNLDSFAARLKGIRIELCLSQEALAHKLGISRVALSYYENGQRTPDIAFLQSLHEATGYPLEYLMGMSEAKETENVNLSAATGLSDEALKFITTNADCLNMLASYAQEDLMGLFASLTLLTGGYWAAEPDHALETFEMLDQMSTAAANELIEHCKIIGYASLSESARMQIRSIYQTLLQGEKAAGIDLLTQIAARHLQRGDTAENSPAFRVLHQKHGDTIAAEKLRVLDEKYREFNP